jgi:hypothetical protein
VWTGDPRRVLVAANIMNGPMGFGERWLWAWHFVGCAIGTITSVNQGR